MRSEGQVRHKLAQVRFRHLKREIRGGLSRRPQNCVHNGSVGTPSGPLGVCLLGAEKPEAWVGTSCDESFGGDARAAECPHFACCRSKDSIREDFEEFLDSANRAQVAERYPDIAALLWTLDEERVLASDSPDDGDDGELEAAPEPVAPEPVAPEPVAPAEITKSVELDPEPVAVVPEPAPAPAPKTQEQVPEPVPSAELLALPSARVSRVPFKPDTWRLALVTALLFLQEKAHSLWEAFRRG